MRVEHIYFFIAMLTKNPINIKNFKKRLKLICKLFSSFFLFLIEKHWTLKLKNWWTIWWVVFNLNFNSWHPYNYLKGFESLTLLFIVLHDPLICRCLQPSEQPIQLIHDGLDCPIYFIAFISVAKLIRAIVILTPGLHTIKEWAYVGLFFDLVGAIYSGVTS